MTCIEIREILSDLIDVRNGEIPPVGQSRLAMPGMRADAEAHLAACDECRAELVIMEEVGAIYADFNVGELPAQHFENYGSVIRQRMSREKIIQLPKRPNIFARWSKMGASAAIAACAAFAFLHFSSTTKLSSPSTKIAFNNKPRAVAKPIPQAKTDTTISVTSPMQGVLPAATMAKDWVFNAGQSKPVIDSLESDEGKYGYLVLSEKTLPHEQALLGLALKTTRDHDIDRSKKDSLGLEIYDIQPDSVAYQMGLNRRDLIVCINGMNIDSGSAEYAVKFLTAVHSLGKGADVTIDVIRRDSEGVLYIQRSGVLGEPNAVIEQ